MLLVAEASDLVAAIEYVLSTADTSHIPAPELDPDERQPESLPEEGIYDAIFDEAVPPRHLKDVWNGAGDVNDPLIPQDSHEHQVVLARLREDPDRDWQHTMGPVATSDIAVIIGGDGVPTTRTRYVGEVEEPESVRGPEYDVDWVAKAERERD